jgi:hypothetical protein
MKLCSIKDCKRPVDAKKLCVSHILRLRKYGDPLATPIKKPKGSNHKWLVDNKNYVGDDCLKWPFSLTSKGYGDLYYNKKRTSASREMCRLAHGDPESDSMHAAHSCGNGHLGCVNPNHLSWKTPKENNKDKIEHGTLARGENHHASTITESQALEIIELRDTMYRRDIAEKLGISEHAVAHVCAGKSWKHLHNQSSLVRSRMTYGENAKSSKLTESDVAEIKALKGVEMQKTIAKSFGVDASTISRIHSGNSWSHTSNE